MVKDDLKYNVLPRYLLWDSGIKLIRYPQSGPRWLHISKEMKAIIFKLAKYNRNANKPSKLALTIRKQNHVKTRPERARWNSKKIFKRTLLQKLKIRIVNN